MKKPTVLSQKRRGPPPTGKGMLVGVRLQPDQLAALDGWIARQSDATTRPEALRRLAEVGLSAGAALRRGDSGAAGKASKLVSDQLDRINDKAVAPKERVKRKRKLRKLSARR